MSNKLIIEEKDLSLIEDKVLNVKQIQHLLKHTPPKYLRTRPAKGGGNWTYVTGGYVKKVLNLMFGWDWDFEIVDQIIQDGEVIVKGRLTCRSKDRKIVKMQYGNKEIVYKKLQEGEKERKPLSIGNDMKAAATDALKKCAAEIGIAADVYNQEEFIAVTIDIEKPKLSGNAFLTACDRIKNGEKHIVEEMRNNFYLSEEQAIELMALDVENNG